MPQEQRDTSVELWRDAAAAFQRGDLDAAETLARTLLGRNPGHFPAQHVLGLIHYRRGQLPQAVPLLRDALHLNPTEPSAHFNLGMVLFELKDASGAIASYRQAVALRPDYAAAWSALSAALAAQGDFAAAGDAARRAVELSPNLVAAAVNLSIALTRLGDETAALETILTCVQRNPASAEAWFWMGQTLHLRGELEAAISAYDQAIAIEPGHVLAHARRGISWLALGDFARGWPEYEWRLRSPDATPRHFSQPRWSGDSLAGRTILVHAEQGLGDAIQMLRYVEPLAAAAKSVIVEVDATLVPLVPRRDNAIPLARGAEAPPFDVYCPLFSLPLAFGTTLESIPGIPSYLKADPARVSAWQQILGSRVGKRRVGVAWAGTPGHMNDHNRSMPFSALAPVLAHEDIAWFSLQVGAAGAAALDSGMIDLAPHLHDFGETAAAMTQLDLVITVDTSVAHLAGALGIPVWILLPLVGEWRWLIDREDTPWYPSARLFHQRAPGDWGGVIGGVAHALATRL